MERRFKPKDKLNENKPKYGNPNLTSREIKINSETIIEKQKNRSSK
ncbi:hypothetical protein [Aquimarina agarivorans]|nr:hypothetical protein [Aquimarina agarivorans]